MIAIVEERTLTAPQPGSGGGDGLCGGEGLEQVRDALDGILAEADRILDNLRPVNAEQYQAHLDMQGPLILIRTVIVPGGARG